MAESADDYGPLFDVKSQFNPSSLTVTGDGQYLLAYPVNAPPYVVPPTRFRVFIPGGAVKVGIEFYASQSAMVAMVARYGIPPQSDYSQINASYWDCYPWDTDASGSLTKLANADMVFRNWGGHGSIIYQPFGTPLTQGGWIYIKVLGSGVFHFQYNVWVDAPSYEAWYASGTVSAASGTVAGSPIFEPISGCSPTDPPPTNNNNNTTNNPLSIFFNVNPQNNNSTDNSNAVGDFFSSLFNGTTPNNPTGSSTRLDVEIDTTANGHGNVMVLTDADLADYSSVILKPSLKFDPLPSDEVDCFALIVTQGTPFLINRETLFNGPAWMYYGGSDRVYKYTRETLNANGTWTCRAFDFLAPYNIPPSVFTENRLQFIFAIAPVGEFERGIYDNLKFGVISFQPEEADQAADNPPADEGAGNPPAEE